MYLSRKTANGSTLTEEERSSFASLREYADRLSVQLDDLACSLQNGSLTIEQLQASEQNPAAFTTPTATTACASWRTASPAIPPSSTTDPSPTTCWKKRRR